MSSTTIDRIRKIVSDHVAKPDGTRWVPDEIKPEHRIGAWDEPGFGEDLGEDSLDRVEIVMEMEDEFHLEISDEDATAWKTIGDMVAYVDGKITAL